MFNDCNGLVVTRIRFMHAREDDARNFKAAAEVVLNGMIVIEDVRVIEARDGRLFLAMPSRKTAAGSHHDVVVLANRRCRDWLEGVVLAAYDRECRRIASQMREAS